MLLYYPWSARSNISSRTVTKQPEVFKRFFILHKDKCWSHIFQRHHLFCVDLNFLDECFSSNILSLVYISFGGECLGYLLNRKSDIQKANTPLRCKLFPLYNLANCFVNTLQTCWGSSVSLASGGLALCGAGFLWNVTVMPCTGQWGAGHRGRAAEKLFNG